MICFYEKVPSPKQTIIKCFRLENEKGGGNTDKRPSSKMTHKPTNRTEGTHRNQNKITPSHKTTQAKTVFAETHIIPKEKSINGD